MRYEDMNVSDLADIKLVPAKTLGLKVDDDVVKLTFKSGKKEEEIVLFQPLFCHAMGLEDDGLPAALKQKKKLIKDAQESDCLNRVLVRVW